MKIDSQYLATIADKLKHLDLDPIKIKLMDKEEGEGWTREEVDNVDLMYRRFLFLIAKYPDNVIVPSKSVDEFWHIHILDTNKYEEDCLSIFGYFIHHFPYLGIRGSEDVKRLQNAFADTCELFKMEFGENYLNDKVSRCNAGRCGSACGQPHCKPKKQIDTARPFLKNPTGPVDIFKQKDEMVEA